MKEIYKALGIFNGLDRFSRQCDFTELASKLIDYQITLEIEEVKREYINRHYSLEEKKTELFFEVINRSIEEKSQDRKKVVDKAFTVVDHLLMEGKVEDAKDILIALIENQPEYITKEIIDVARDTSEAVSSEDYIEIKPEE